MGHVHDYPEVGMLRETDVRFTFKGPLKKVEGILSNFNNAMGTVTCKGCPAGMGGRKKRDTSSQPLNLDLCFSPLTEGSEQQTKSHNHPNNKPYQMCETMPATRTTD